MCVMEHTHDGGRASLAVVLACLGTAGAFEALTVLATQDKTVRAVSPWQDDPYDAVVSLAQFTVPMLGLVIGMRLFAWRAPGGPDRVQQTTRAAAAMITLVAVTLAFEWAALVGGAHAASWGPQTSVLVGGLVVASLLTVVMTLLLVRRRAPRGSSRRWQHDWLGDVVVVCRRIPVVRRWATPVAVTWIRRRAMAVFTTLSVLAAAVIIGFLAVGEGWTNPLLIAWALVVETTSNLAFCLVSNRVAGFIARPARSPSRHAAEASLLAGCVAVQVATAFRDVLWPVFGMGPLTSVVALAALTLGAGLAASLATAAALLARARRPINPTYGDAR
jgi:hypothetical protein